MNSSGVAKTGAVVSFVDLALIVAMFVHFNKRIGVLEKNTGNVSASSKAVASKSSNTSKLEDRVITLESDIEVLLQRLHCYDDLLGKIIGRIKETDLPTEKYTECTPPRMTSIRSRKDESLLARKEPFVEVNVGDEPQEVSYEVESDSDEDEMFSFLKE